MNGRFQLDNDRWTIVWTKSCAATKMKSIQEKINKAGYTGQDSAPALLILRPIPSSIRPIPSSIYLTVDEYDNEWNDE